MINMARRVKMRFCKCCSDVLKTRENVLLLALFLKGDKTRTNKSVGHRVIPYLIQVKLSATD